MLRGCAAQARGVELELSITAAGGRLTGTARRPDRDGAVAFSGALELLACVERLCLDDAAAQPLPENPTVEGR